MECSSCGEVSAESARFCHACGTALTRLCPGCGTPAVAGHAFCESCGTALAPAVAASAAVPVAERRVVSVLFVDLVGFTTLSESRDAEQVRELLSTYFETARSLVERYGGTVEKFIGDAVMAVWGSPVATEHDAERAVRAALDLVAAVAEIGREHGLDALRARAGVVTGEAAVTLGLEHEGMVAGDMVNTASRVQTTAPPGEVFVSETTRRATEQTIVYEPAGSFALKGKTGEMPLWRARRVISGAHGALRSEGLESPFVGRDRELRQIKDLFHVTADDRTAHLLTVTGVGGIGKSRLSWEFYKYFDGIAEDVFWHRGRCLPYGDGVAYSALAEMVRMRCRIGEDEPAGPALEKLRSALDEYVTDPEERRFVEPRLAQLVGAGEAQETDRQSLFTAWRVFFERLSDVFPAVLVFEDMQWADDALLDFLEHLLDVSRNRPLFVVVLARPELAERRPAWGAGVRHLAAISLEPLPRAAMAELLSGLSPGLPDTLTNQILDRSEGIPMYAMETVRMLLDRGALVRQGSVYQPVGEISALEVPETLHALIAARLDGLAPQERKLLQDGAVLGKTFTKPAIAAVSGLDDGQLDPLLTGLVRKEVLTLQTDPRSPEHGHYGFLQELVRRVAYETLAMRDRRARHLAAANYLDEVASDGELAEVAAAHLVDAYNAWPDAPDAEDVKQRAVYALVLAGERSASLAATGEAQRSFERAAALTDDPLVQGRLASRAGQMAWLAGRFDSARALLEQALETFEREGDARDAARAASALGDIELNEGHAQVAIDRLTRALDALQGVEDDPDVAALAGQLARLYALTGDHESAAAPLELALRSAAQLDQPETLAQAMLTKGVLLMNTDRLIEARVMCVAGIDLAVEHELHAAALRGYNNLAVLYEAVDDLRGSQAASENATELARRIGDRRTEGVMAVSVLGGLVAMGRWDEALEMLPHLAEFELTATGQTLVLDAITVYCAQGRLDDARALLESFPELAELEEGLLVAQRGIRDAELLRSEGRPDEAVVVARATFRQVGAYGSSNLQWKVALGELLECLLALGLEGEARELLAEVATLKPGQITPLIQAITARFGARLAVLDGTDPDAQFELAAGILRDREWRYMLAQTLLEHGESLTARGELEQARPLLAEARAIFAELRATPWLERLSGVLPQAAPVS